MVALFGPVLERGEQRAAVVERAEAVREHLLRGHLPWPRPQTDAGRTGRHDPRGDVQPYERLVVWRHGPAAGTPGPGELPVHRASAAARARDQYRDLGDRGPGWPDRPAYGPVAESIPDRQDTADAGAYGLWCDRRLDRMGLRVDLAHRHQCGMPGGGMVPQ